MSQTWDVDLISPTGTSPSADIQRIIDGFNTVRSTWSGASEPAVADRVAYMLWADTTTGLLKIRNAANTAWVTIGTMAIANMGQLASFSQAKTGAYTVVAADRGSLISCTGTFTLTFTAAATLGDGFTSIVRNDGTGFITLDANSAELIDGQLTVVLMPGETAIVYCTGSALKTFNRYPSGGMGAPNPIINGSFDIWQRGATFVGAGSGSRFADKWVYAGAGTSSVVTINRSSNVPTLAQAGALLTYSFEVDCTTADVTQDAGDYTIIYTKIEGYDWRHLAQRPFTISFWVMSTKTGIYGISFQGTGTSNMYTTEYTVNVADTWEWKTITVPASPSSGGWDYTNGTGLAIYFCLMGGTTFHMTANSWQTPGATKFTTANQVNALDNVANFWRLAAVKIEPGNQATPIQYIPFEVELARCKRYYQKSFVYDTKPAQNVGINTGEHQVPSLLGGAVQQNLPPIYFNVELRGVPGIVLYNPAAANAQIRNEVDNSDFTATFADTGITSKFLRIYGTGTAGTAVGELLGIHWAADADL